MLQEFHYISWELLHRNKTAFSIQLHAVFKEMNNLCYSLEVVFCFLLVVHIMVVCNIY